MAPRNNFLIYSITRERLEGSVDGEFFSMTARAGGGRGRTAGDAEHSAASYDVFRKENKAKRIRGGPLPPGIYTCHYVANHQKYGDCIFLQMNTVYFELSDKGKVNVADRDEMFIHLRGPRGSDGCIVPENDADRLRLNQAVKKAAGRVLLQVTEKGLPVPDEVDKKARTSCKELVRER